MAKLDFMEVLTKYKCIFSDLDKTLLNAEGTISDYTRTTIQTIISHGIEFVPSSGRAFFSLPECLSDIRGLKYVITSNGACINDYNAKIALDKSCIPESTIERLAHYTEKLGAFVEVFINGQGYTQRPFFDDPSLIRGCNDFRIKYVRTTRKPVDDMRTFILDNRKDIESFVILVHPDKSSELEAKTRFQFPETYITRSEKHMIEISNINSGKHRGMGKFCSLMKIKPEETIAFGDAANDIEMLCSAGLGIAVANATEECRKSADRISEKSNNDDGVAAELRTIFPFWFQ